MCCHSALGGDWSRLVMGKWGNRGNFRVVVNVKNTAVLCPFSEFWKVMLIFTEIFLKRSSRHTKDTEIAKPACLNYLRHSCLVVSNIRWAVVLKCPFPSLRAVLNVTEVLCICNMLHTCTPSSQKIKQMLAFQPPKALRDGCYRYRGSSWVVFHMEAECRIDIALVAGRWWDHV